MWVKPWVVVVASLIPMVSQMILARFILLLLLRKPRRGT